VIGWDEIIDNGFDTTAVVMSWRGPQDGGQDGATHGYRVIKVPNTHLYFDYQYAEGDTIGAPYWRKIPLDSVYAYRPVPEYFTPAQAANVIGVQGNVWTEFIPSFREVQYMALPRMAALAELQWCDAPKDFDAFIGRLRCLLPLYEAEGYCYRPLENK
jgi:hexosaminidase